MPKLEIDETRRKSPETNQKATAPYLTPILTEGHFQNTHITPQTQPINKIKHQENSQNNETNLPEKP